METADFLVVGGGVVGLTTALELRRRLPDVSIRVIEKEPACGLHASGRNSGVIHAGFYYTSNSLKARLTKEGNRRLTSWCEEHGVAVRRCGKLVVARNEREHEGFEELLRRAKENDVALERISMEECREIEPRAKTYGHALWSPSSSAVDPRRVMDRLVDVAGDRGVRISTSTEWEGARGGVSHTSHGAIDAGFVVNASGLYAAHVARAYGFGHGYRMVPFRGVYLYANGSFPALNTHVYPVPDLAMPFLGVHFTVTADGTTKIGPTAMPAAWLEHYEGVAGFNAREVVTTALCNARLFFAEPSFRRHAATELAKLWRPWLVEHASSLVDGVAPASFDRWGAPGIRAQLYDVEKNALVMDFCFEGDDRSLHVLNAVSPAFTCSFSFAELIVDRVLRAA